MSAPALHYADGEEIKQKWNGVFILYAYIAAFVASYGAVRLLEQSLWRSEREKTHANALTLRYPRTLAALLLGCGTVWSMHFIGNQAVTLERTPMCYNWPLTIASLACSVFFMWAGVQVASRDIFAGPDREKRLKEILINKPEVTSKGTREEAKRTIHMIAYFHKLHFIISGSILAASGALIMHYTGMVAVQGSFYKEWRISFIAASVVLGILVCFVGFWIIFRPLHFKVEQMWLRPVSAATIALAVCGLHFFGMLSVRYVADSALSDECSVTLSNSAEAPNSWNVDQTLVLGVALLVPSATLFVEHTICQELRMSYCELKDFLKHDIESLLRMSGSNSGASASSFPLRDHLRRQRSAPLPQSRALDSKRSTRKGFIFSLDKDMHQRETSLSLDKTPSADLSLSQKVVSFSLDKERHSAQKESYFSLDKKSSADSPLNVQSNKKFKTDPAQDEFVQEQKQDRNNTSELPAGEKKVHVQSGDIEDQKLDLSQTLKG